MTPSDFPRCVRLHHTPQGSNKQKTLLKCTNENYTCMYHSGGGAVMGWGCDGVGCDGVGL